jgi:hypothetical protein
MSSLGFITRIFKVDSRRWIHSNYMEMAILSSLQAGAHILLIPLSPLAHGYLLTFTSDTTSSTITHLLFYLACNRPLAIRLQEELDKLLEINDDNLRSIDLLDASIHETLRLRPAVPAGLQRVTPKEGIQIGDRYIPGDVIVKIPMYTLFRGESLRYVSITNHSTWFQGKYR